MDEKDVQLYRERGIAIVEWVEEALHEVGLDSYWSCIESLEALEEEIMYELAQAKEDLSGDWERSAKWSQLLKELAGKSQKDRKTVELILDRELERFVLQCAQNPGPRQIQRQGKPKLEWNVAFKKDVFDEVVRGIERILSMDAKAQPVEIWTNCRWFAFDSDFSLQQDWRYSSGTNQFVVTCDPGLTRQQAEQHVLPRLRFLSALVKLTSSFRYGLGRSVILYPYSRGGERSTLCDQVSRVGSAQTVDLPDKLNAQLLVSCWGLCSGAIDSNFSMLMLPRLESLSEPPEDRLIDLVTCYEIILADGAEITYKLKTRGASLLTVFGVTETYGVLEAAYEIRSDIVHGRIPITRLDITQVRDVNTKLEIWLRLLTIARLLWPTSKESFLKLVDLLVTSLIDAPSLSDEQGRKVREFLEAFDPLKSLVDELTSPEGRDSTPSSSLGNSARGGASPSKDA